MLAQSNFQYFLMMTIGTDEMGDADNMHIINWTVVNKWLQAPFLVADIYFWIHNMWYYCTRWVWYKKQLRIWFKFEMKFKYKLNNCNAKYSKNMMLQNLKSQKKSCTLNKTQLKLKHESHYHLKYISTIRGCKFKKRTRNNKHYITKDIITSPKYTSNWKYESHNR